MALVYASAERLGEEEGSPRAIPVYEGDEVVAYIFSTLGVVAAPGYSGVPFDVIAGVDLSGAIPALYRNDFRERYQVVTNYWRYPVLSAQRCVTGAIPVLVLWKVSRQRVL